MPNHRYSPPREIVRRIKTTPFNLANLRKYFAKSFASMDIRPATDLHERDDAFVLHIDVSGYKKEDIKIEVTDDFYSLVVTTGVSGDNENNSFARVYYFTDPIVIDCKNIKANITADILNIQIPKLKGPIFINVD